MFLNFNAFDLAIAIVAVFVGIVVQLFCVVLGTAHRRVVLAIVLLLLVLAVVVVIFCVVLVTGVVLHIVAIASTADIVVFVVL